MFVVHYFKGGKSKVSRPKVPKFSVRSAIVAVLLIASIGAAGFFWNDARQAKQQSPEGVAQKNQQETDQVVSSLSKIIVPEGEDKPTVARVENPDTLKKANQDFYKNVQVGDYLVLYPQRAIIYRLGENKIVNIAPIINSSDLQKSQSQAATQDTSASDKKTTTTPTPAPTPTPPTKTTR